MGNGNRYIGCLAMLWGRKRSANRLAGAEAGRRCGLRAFGKRQRAGRWRRRLLAAAEATPWGQSSSAGGGARVTVRWTGTSQKQGPEILDGPTGTAAAPRRAGGGGESVIDLPRFATCAPRLSSDGQLLRRLPVITEASPCPSPSPSLQTPRSNRDRPAASSGRGRERGEGRGGARGAVAAEEGRGKGRREGKCSARTMKEKAGSLHAMRSCEERTTRSGP